MNLIPWYYRAAAIVALIVAVFGTGWVKGLHHQEAVDELAFEKERQLQDKLAIHAGQVALDRANTISAVVDSYEDDRVRVGRYYADKLRASASRNASPLSTNTLPARTDEAPPHIGLVTFIELEARCSETTLQLVNLQKAAKAFEDIK